MKKKWWLIAVIIIFIILGLIIVLRGVGNQILLNDIETVTVMPATLRWKYRTQGTIVSNKHEYFFEGRIVAVYKKEGERISKDEAIFRYKDNDDKEKDYVSEIDGFLEELTADRVVISDLDYYLRVMLKGKQYDLIGNECEALFLSDGTERLGRLLNKNDYGIMKDGGIYYESDFKLDDVQNLKLNQQGNVTILLKENAGLMAVDERAVLQKKDGNYLLNSRWLEGNVDEKACLVKINVLAYEEGKAFLDDRSLEGMQVCVLSDAIMEILQND